MVSKASFIPLSVAWPLNNLIIFSFLTLQPLQRYDAISWYDDSYGVSQLTIDSNKFVYVGGSIYNIMKFSDLGISLWNLTHSGEFLQENIHEITTDSTGDIYYTGYTTIDCLTVKYSNAPPTIINPLFEEKNINGLIIGIQDFYIPITKSKK